MPIAAVIGGVAQMAAARSASRAQQRAAGADMEFQRETRDLVRGDLAPYRETGDAANQMVLNELQGRSQFTADPGYQFRLREGNNSINALAGARGGLLSGRTLSDLARFNQDLASQEYGNYWGRITGQQALGMNAAAGQGTAATNAAAGVSNALSNIGDARAAGAIGMGNAINSGINNAVGIWQYQQGVNGGNRGVTVGRPGSLFGGNSWG